MTPVVGVDLEALNDLRKQCCPDSNGVGLPGCALERRPETDADGADRQAQIGNAAEPAIGMEGVEKHIVRRVTEEGGKAQRADALGVVEQHRQRAQLVSEAAGRAQIVGLVQRSPHLEDLADARIGEGDHKDQADERRPENACDDDAGPQS